MLDCLSSCLNVEFILKIAFVLFLRFYQLEVGNICVVFSFKSSCSFFSRSIFNVLILMSLFLCYADYFVTKCGVLIMSLFVFFTTTMSVSFTLRETQSRMLRFTGLCLLLCFMSYIIGLFFFLTHLHFLSYCSAATAPCSPPATHISVDLCACY